MLDSLLKTFVVFFVVVEPISLVPMFAALTRGGGDDFRRRMAIKAVALSAVIFALFLITGDVLLRVLGITLDAFKIAGGVLLFLLAVDMVFARQSGLRSATVREQEEARFRQDISVFPLAFPLIAGPGALATLLLLGSGARNDPVAFAALALVVALVLAITLLLLLGARHVEQVIGVTGANVISRLAGVILVALAVQFVIDGVRDTVTKTRRAMAEAATIESVPAPLELPFGDDRPEQQAPATEAAGEPVPASAPEEARAAPAERREDPVSPAPATAEEETPPR